MASGKDGVATPRELAAYVTSVLGEEVSAQRDAVRAWIARSESGQLGPSPGATPSSSLSAAAMSLSGPDAVQTSNIALPELARPRRRPGLFLILAVLLLAVGGVVSC